MPRTDRVAGATDSRAATNELLADLRTRRWRPHSWARFLRRATRRSVHQARLRPRALTEVTLLHGAFLVVGHRPRWTVSCWMLTTTHLGMLEDRRTLGIANLLTLTRANLPAVDAGSGRWLGPVAAATDLLDGGIARATRCETHFGCYADPLTDAAVWTDFAFRHEPHRLLRLLPIVVWGASAVVVTTSSFHRGRMLDRPQPVLLRLGAALEMLLAVRMAWRDRRTSASEVPLRTKPPRTTATSRRAGPGS